MGTTRLRIFGVNEIDKYKGSYKKIFEILRRDDIFSESYETDESIGLKDSIYYLEVGENIESHHMESILKFKNVKEGWQ